MGSICCVAAREKTLTQSNNAPSPVPYMQYNQVNSMHSPSWSFQWDGRSHVETSVDSSVQAHRDMSGRSSGNMASEFKGEFGSGTISNGESPMESYRTPTWTKSPVHPHDSDDFNTSVSDINSSPSLMQKYPAEEKIFNRSPTLSDNSKSKLLQFVPSTPSASRSKTTDPSSSRNYLNDHGSQGGSSDRWSMRTFSELVASSRRERWSFDSECLVGKMTRSNSHHLSSPSMDLQACAICSKPLIDRSPYSSQNLITSYDAPVVGVLFCGHVYHADCLEHTTPEPNRYDPPCPLCLVGEKGLKIRISREKASRLDASDSRVRNKISRIGVADIDLDNESLVPNRHRDGKDPKMVATSSAKGFLGGPFLKRHFSIGSRTTRSVSENDSTRRKSFWGRIRRD
ncbi:hypothetical protein AMTRI_Chr03g142550 [Amborella trichopoda]|nr:uncharacterized protein LOC18437359 [Amborella trichopoda]XP_011624528.1 uncharacterized protein LOC18437359 [Amborella trichopoda]XP_020524733.1 uncharacterized protein LOC18437359 [Amborella trichopoda]|eukprot:XP_011624527.1 uncharacterized protein LOC18437359 [Amborella trichopoda]